MTQGNASTPKTPNKLIPVLPGGVASNRFVGGSIFRHKKPKSFGAYIQGMGIINGPNGDPQGNIVVQIMPKNEQSAATLLSANKTPMGVNSQSYAAVQLP